MTAKDASHRPGFVPGAKWRWVRRFTQVAVLATVLVAPLMGGWQRMDRNYLSAWDGRGWDLPQTVLDALPMGDTPRAAYAANQLMGGGASMSAFGLPAIDPVAGAVVASTGSISLMMLVSWMLPLLLGLLAGRFFCGWLCPFGALSRGIDKLMGILPWRPPRLKLPRRRPLRWVILGACVVVGVAGVQGMLYLFLPHVMVQQTGYAFWLMGGGGAAVGWLLGLILAGVIFGPTAYCATLCPTGAALSIPGRARRFHIYIADKPTCGTHCTLCSQVCWLGLDPASGDPGPDCDMCARCFPICPRANLRVGPVSKRGTTGRGGRASAAVIIVIVAAAIGGLLLLNAPSSHASDWDDTPASQPADWDASDPMSSQRIKPLLVFHEMRTLGDVALSVSLVDLTGVRNDADDATTLEGTEITVFMARGGLAPPDRLGYLEPRASYAGKLALRLEVEGVSRRFDIDAPNWPQSTQRSVFRRIVPEQFAAGDSVEVLPIAGWLDTAERFEVMSSDPGQGVSRVLWPLGAGLLVFSGLLSLALAVGKGRAGV